jgi:multiple sugar transport system substrate-binding protein
VTVARDIAGKHNRIAPAKVANPDRKELPPMTNPSRRSLLRATLAVAAAGGLARPYIANAATTTATVWMVQGFAQQEDVAFKKLVADYEKASGNTIDDSIIPFVPHRQKVISAMTSGEVPDLFVANPPEMTALFAW